MFIAPRLIQQHSSVGATYSAPYGTASNSDWPLGYNILSLAGRQSIANGVDVFVASPGHTDD